MESFVAMNAPLNCPIQYAKMHDGIVVVRVNGKGTFLQSPALAYVFDQTRYQTPQVRYIFDLAECSMMDSTFMGTLAKIAMFQRSKTGTPVIVVNLQDHMRHLLTTLGLHFALDMRDGQTQPLPATYTPANAPEITSMDRIIMMIEAHETLVEVDSHNEVKFEGVLQDLRDSLEHEKQKRR